MNYYIFAATAIPALWAAGGLMRAPSSSARAALQRTGRRLLLLLGEVAAIATLTAPHDGYVGAALSALALIVGVTGVIGSATARDLKTARLPVAPTVSVGALVALMTFAYSTAR